jgi:hypothetical protein
MSVTVLQLLPNLKQIQKILETNFVKYGSSIQFDPVSDGNVPSKHKNINMVSQINRELLKYGAAKDRVKKVATFNAVKAWFFESIILILLAVVLIIFTYKAHFSGSKIWNLSSSTAIAKGFLMYVIGMIIIAWIMYASIHYTKGYTGYNRIVNNIDDFQNSGNVINNVVHILDVKPVDNGRTFEIQKAHPLYMHFFASKYGEDRVRDVRGPNAEDDDGLQKAFKLQDEQGIVKEVENKLYPFVGADAIDPFVLKKDLQKFDYYDQMSQLEQAVKAFEVILSKSNNVDIKIKKVDPDVMRKTIAEIIIKGENLSDRQSEYIQTIVDVVTTTDRSQTYILDDPEIKTVLFSLKGYNDVKLDEGVVASILNSAAPLIEKVRLLANKGDQSEFITYNDFVEKISSMSSKEFVIKVVHNAEKIRAATNGIAEFNALYNTGILYDTKMSIAKTSLIIMGILMILCIVLLVLNTYESFTPISFPSDNGVLGDEQIKNICNNIFSKINNQCPTENDTALPEEPDTKIPEVGMMPPWPSITENGGGVDGGGVDGGFKTVADNTRRVFVITIIACSAILFYIILWSLYNKNVSLNTYNKSMMEENSFIMRTKAISVMQSIYDDVKMDVFGIKEFGITQEKIVNLMKEGISIDATKKLDAGASDVPGELLFEVIVNSSSVDDQNYIKLRSTRNNLNDVYSSLCAIISSYNKCNNIYSLFKNGVPFPWTSIVVYIIMLLICAVAIMLIGEEFHVSDATTNIVRISYIKQILKEVGAKTDLSGEDQNYIELLLKKQEKDNSSDGKRIALFITGIVIMIAVTILFSIVISNEPNLYTSALYSSKQFRSNECFD